MTKTGYLLLILSFGLLGLLFYLFKGQPYRFQLKNTPTRFPEEIALDQLISQMSLEEKVGVLFLVGFNGTSLTPDQLEFFQTHHFSRFLLLSPNIQNPTQLSLLTQDLYVKTRSLHITKITEENVKTGSLQPMIGIDQEGGAVNRINLTLSDLSDFSDNSDPSDFSDSSDSPTFRLSDTPTLRHSDLNSGQPEITSPDQAYNIAKNRGLALKKLNININFSPVLEVVSNPNSFINQQHRAFTGKQDQVLKLSQAMIQGYQDAGIISIPKHYPGSLGRVSADPHQLLPIVNINRQEFDQDNWIIKALINTQNLQGLMVTHLQYPQIDPDYPSSLSKIIITDILRGDYGFQGLIVTDDLRMKGITNQYPIPQSAKLAFQAGVDLLMISGPSQDQDLAYQAILEAVKTGEITTERLNTSLKRIFNISKSP